MTPPSDSLAPPRDGPAQPRRRGAFRWVWWTCVVATILNGIVVGYGAVWFQLFGDSADREDYLVSAGGYLAAAAVLALALPSAHTVAPRWGRLVTALGAVVLALCALASANSAALADQGTSTGSGVLDGVGGVVLLPWVWLLLAVSVGAAWRRLRRPA